MLLTGAGGFVGAALLRRLGAAGAELVASDLDGPAGTEPCDVTDADAVLDLVGRVRPDTILHLGAVSGPMVIPDRPLDIWRINASGAVHLLEAARRTGVARTIVCSTTEVFGATVAGAVGPATCPAPDDVYGASKLAAEEAVRGYRLQHRLDAVALRLGWVYGPGRRTPTTLEALCRHALSGDAGTLSAGPDHSTHYLHLDDAVAGMMLGAGAVSLPCHAYTISAGPGRPMSEVAATITRLVPGAKIVCDPADRTPSGPTGFDLDTVGRDLGYHPAVTLERGLRATLQNLAELAGSPCG